MQNIDRSNIQLSILIPCYNVSKYIDECLDSIYDQMTDQCEIIIYDDGSKDDTVNKIKEHKIIKNPRVCFIIEEKNGGLSYARNNMIKKSNGQYVWFLDSDDKILDGAISSLLNCIQEFQSDIIFFDYNAWPVNPTCRMIRKGFQRSSFAGAPGLHCNVNDSLYNLTVKSTRLHAWSKVYSRALFQTGTEFPVGKIFEDIAVIPLLSAYAKTAYYLNKPLLAYRMREGSILSSLTFENEIESLKAINDLKNRYENNIGPLSKKSQLVTIYFAACQLRPIIKVLAKHPDKEKRADLIACCLREFKKIHGKNILYPFYACLREGDFSQFFHFTKRFIQAYFLCGIGRKSLSEQGG